MASISTALNKQTTTDFAVNEESSTQAATRSDKASTLANKIYDIDVTKDAKQQAYIQPATTSISTEVETERFDFSKPKAGGNTVNDTAGASINGVKANSFKTSVVSVHYYRNEKRFRAVMTIKGRVDFVYVSASYSDMFSHNEALTDKGYTTAAQLQQELISKFKNTPDFDFCEYRHNEIHQAFKKKGRFDEKRQCYVHADMPKRSIPSNRTTSPPINSKHIPYNHVSYRKDARIFKAQLIHKKIRFTCQYSIGSHSLSQYWNEQNNTLTDAGKDIAKNAQKGLIQKLRAAHPEMTLEEQHACFTSSTYDATEECYYKDTRNIPNRIESKLIPVYGISYICICDSKKNPSYCFRFRFGNCEYRKRINLSACRKIWDEGNQRLTALGLELAENTQRIALKKYNNTLPCDNEIIQKKTEYCTVRKVFYKRGKMPLPVPKGHQLPQTQDSASNTDIMSDSSESLPSPNPPYLEPLAAESCDGSATNESSEASSDDAQSRTNDTLARSNTPPPTITVKQEPDLRLPKAHLYHDPELTFRNKAKTTLCNWMTDFNKRRKTERTVFEYDSGNQKYSPITHQQKAQKYQKYLEEWFSSTPSQRAKKEQELVTVKQISEDDPRIGLRNQNGLFASTKDIEENCILGVYSGTYMLYGENIEDRTDIRAELDFLQQDYACGSDAYSNYTISIILNNESILTVSGLHRGSACSFINTAATNDRVDEVNAEVNTIFKIVMLKGQPPVVLAVTTKTIPASAEIITHYGNHYWEQYGYGRNKAQPIGIPLDVLEQFPETEQLNDDDRKLYTESDIKQAAATTTGNKTVKSKVGKKRQNSDDHTTKKRTKRTRHS